MRASRPWFLIGLEGFTGIAALIGGLLLAIDPDGSLLHARLSALSGSPFADYRVPGIFLAGLVGVGFLVTAVYMYFEGHLSRELSIFAGCGLIIFEASELAWLGFQPLEAILSIVGIIVAWQSWRLLRARKRRLVPGSRR